MLKHTASLCRGTCEDWTFSINEADQGGHLKRWIGTSSSLQHRSLPSLWIWRERGEEKSVVGF